MISRAPQSLWFYLLILLALPLSKAGAALPIPNTYTLVNDQIGLLSISQVYDLEKKLSALENHNGMQIVLLIVPTTGQEGIESYSLRVAEAWQPGHNGESTGVLFAIDAQAGEFFIRTGSAVAGALPDVMVRRIWMENLAPHWRKQEWYEGIDATIDAMIEILWREQTEPPQWYTTYSLTTRGWLGVSLILLAVVYTAFHLIKWRRSRIKEA